MKLLAAFCLGGIAGALLACGIIAVSEIATTSDDWPDGLMEEW